MVPLGCDCFSGSCSWWPRQFLGMLIKYFGGCLYGDLSDVFLMVRCLWVWRKKITEVKCHFHHIISKLHHGLWTADVDLDHLVMFVRLFHCKVAPHIPLYTYSWEGSRRMQPTPKEWVLMPPSFRVKYLHGSFGILHVGNLSPLHLLSHPMISVYLVAQVLTLVRVIPFYCYRADLKLNNNECG